MDKQQFDNIEHRIREAAEHLSPPFEEEAWQKMEVLLDKEFEKDRRRIVWWLPLLLLLLSIGVGTYFYTRIEGKKEAKAAAQQATGSSNHAGNASRNPIPKEHAIDHVTDAKDYTSRAEDQQASKHQPGTGSAAKKLSEASDPEVEQTTKVPHNNHLAGAVEQVPAGIRHLNRLKAGEKLARLPHADQSEVLQESNTRSKELGMKAQIDGLGAVDKTSSVDGSTTGQGALNSLQPDTKAFQNKAPGKAANTDKEVHADSTLVKNSTAKSLKTVKPKAASKLYFLASIAPEVNSVKAGKINTVSPVFGIGVGYRLNKKLSIQTGFYMGKKIYKAGPSDYVFKKGTYLSMVNMHSINGDCMVYDVPVTVRYNFSQKKRYTLYAAPGISSYIMKKEDYEYAFNHPGSTTEIKSLYTYSGNKHLLSVLNLSAGYERQVSGAVSIHAEPYLKVPLSGVGDGKVKLYSAGINFGLKYQPLKNRR